MFNFFKKHLAFILLCAILFSYLGVKSFPENGWGGWLDGLGDAATMLSLKYWAKDGLVANKFLFIPIGYSKIVRYFDDPAMRQHARGTATGGLVGNRLYYTHYPGGYLIPYALLMKLGVEGRPYFRILSLVFSFAALVLMYWLFNLLTANRLISFFSALYYAISLMFIDFADSLANQPIDDLFRFAILVVSVLALKHLDKQKTYNILIWLLYFILSISSYDSTFFVFVWLVGLDIALAQFPISNFPACHALQGIAGRQFPKNIIEKISALPWKKWLFFGSAPVLGFGLQILQNSWYLGFSNMITDFLNAFNKVGLSGNSSQGFVQLHYLQGILFPITESFAFLFRSRYAFIFILAIALILFAIKKSKAISGQTSPLFSYLFVLMAAGFFQTLIILDNHPYKGRVLGLFASFLIGIFIFSIIRLIKNKSDKILLFALIPLTVFMIFLQANKTLAYIKQWPNNPYDYKKVEFDKELKQIAQSSKPQDTVIFSMFPPQSYDNERITSAMATYYDMYYSGAPIVYFNDVSEISRDFNYLKQISKYPFSAMMILKNKEQADELIQLQQKTSPNSSEAPIKTITIQDKYILIFPSI